MNELTIKRIAHAFLEYFPASAADLTGLSAREISHLHAELEAELSPRYPAAADVLRFAIASTALSLTAEDAARMLYRRADPADLEALQAYLSKMLDQLVEHEAEIEALFPAPE